MPKKIDWDGVRVAYEDSSDDIESISTAFDVHVRTISKKASAESWVKLDVSVVTESALVSGDNPIICGVGIRKMAEIKESLGDDYDPVDEALILMYSENYQSWIEVCIDLKKEGFRIEGSRGNLVINPLFRIKESIESRLSKLSSKLGLSIAERKHLGRESGKSRQTNSLFDLEEEISRLSLDI